MKRSALRVIQFATGECRGTARIAVSRNRLEDELQGKLKLAVVGCGRVAGGRVRSFGEWDDFSGGVLGLRACCCCYPDRSTDEARVRRGRRGQRRGNRQHRVSARSGRSQCSQRSGTRMTAVFRIKTVQVDILVGPLTVGQQFAVKATPSVPGQRVPAFSGIASFDVDAAQADGYVSADHCGALRDDGFIVGSLTKRAKPYFDPNWPVRLRRCLSNQRQAQAGPSPLRAPTAIPAVI